MIEIPLTQGKIALIDDEDYPIVSLFKWSTFKHRNTFYAVTSIYKSELIKKTIKLGMHRLILNAKSNELTDHADMDGLNNRRYNLRKCTNSQNCMNKRNHKNGSSKYKGVGWQKNMKKWRVRIMLNGEHMYLGYFIDEVEAARAYDKKAIELFGAFAHTNFN